MSVKPPPAVPAHHIVASSNDNNFATKSFKELKGIELIGGEWHGKGMAYKTSQRLPDNEIKGDPEDSIAYVGKITHDGVSPRPKVCVCQLDCKY